MTRLIVAMMALCTLAPSANPQAARVDAEGFALPAEAIARIGFARLRHRGPIRGVAYAADGNAIVSFALDNTIRTWDASSGKLMRTTPMGELFMQHFLHASRIGGKSVDVFHRGSIYSFDPHAGKPLGRIFLDDVPGPNRGCYSPDGKLLAFGFSGGGSIYIRNALTGKTINSFEVPSSPHDMCFTPDGTRLAIVRANSDGVSFHDVNTGKRAFELQVPAPQPYRIAISPDGTRLLTANYNDPQHTLWDLTKRKRLCELQGEGRDWRAEAYAFSPDSRRVARGGERGAVGVFDTTDGKELHSLPFRGACHAVAFSADGLRLVAGNDRGEIAQWDLAIGKTLASAEPPGGIQIRRFMADGVQFLAQTDRLVLYSSKTGQRSRTLPWSGPDYMLRFIELSPDGKLLAVPIDKGEIVLRDAQTGKDLRTLAGHPRAVWVMVFSPDGKRLFTSGTDNMIRVWDMQTGKQLHEIEGSGDPGGPFARVHNPHEYIAVSPDGRRFATAAFLYTDAGVCLLRVWDADSGKLLHQLGSKKRFSERLAFTPAGDLLYASDGTQDGDGDVFRLIDPSTGSVRWTLALKRTHVVSLAFSPDGHTLAMGGNDGTLRLYETATGRLRHAFTGHARAVDGLAFTPDGALLAASSLDAPVLIWDVYGKSDAASAVKWSANQADDWWARLMRPPLESYTSYSDSAASEFDAVRSLVQNPAPAVAMLRERLVPCEAVAEPRLQHLLRDLDSEEFEQRQTAYNTLEGLAERVEFRLRAAIAEKRSLEAKRRLQALVARLDPVSHERLRSARALEALEQIGTSEAVRLLEALAAGEPGARLTREASAALARLRNRQNARSE